MRKQLINENWEFSRPYTQPGVDTLPDYKRPPQTVEKVTLPHDYSITLPRSKNAWQSASNGYFSGGFGTYHRYLNFEPGKHYILNVDGAFACSELFFNRSLHELHPHGYAPYLVDLTPYILPDVPNRLEIQTNDLFRSRWYSGAGIYRDLFLWEGGAVRIEPWDYFVYTERIERNYAFLHADVKIKNDVPYRGRLTLSVSGDGRVFETAVPVTLDHAGELKTSLPLKVTDPLTWSPDTPFLYDAALVLTDEAGEVLDRAEWKLGIRTLRFSAEEGCVLNGRSIKLRGGCIHHDHGVLGAVSLPAAEERKISKLKSVGYNAIRSSHNPPSTALLETCDRLGMILMDEIFDFWNIGKFRMDYHLFFRDHWKADTDAMVLRDRNHCSVFSYSSGNELPNRDCSYGAVEIARQIADEFRALDPTRPATVAINGLGSPIADRDAPEGYAEAAAMGDYLEKDSEVPKYRRDCFNEVTNAFFADVDIIGLNYAYKTYEQQHEGFPTKAIWGSETHALSFYYSWEKVMKYPYVIGDFTWTAYDNLGEAGTGRFAWERDDVIPRITLAAYPFRSCFQGDFDLAGYRRPQSFFRESIWCPDASLGLFTTDPEHLDEGFSGTGWHWYDVLDSWTYDEKWIGHDIDAEAYSTAELVEFWLNGEKVAEKAPEAAIAKVRIRYIPGTLEARAIRNGRVTAVSVLHTTGKAAALRVTAEKESFAADYRDLCYFDIEIDDENGRRVAAAGPELKASVEGGELIGIFSGDPCNEDRYGSPFCHAFHGNATAIVRTRTPGTVKLTVEAEGLRPGFASAPAK